VSEPPRTVSSHLVADVREPALVVLQVTVADPSTAQETLSVTLDGTPVEPVEIAVAGEGRLHRLDVGIGRLVVDYRAIVSGRVPAESVTAAEALTYLRPSRYAESDRLAAVAFAEFRVPFDPAELLSAVSSWVGTRLAYVAGSSAPTDGAVDTMLSRRGVCRDFAHLVIALLRAMDVPARLAAVYAPGLDPMDFHAVAEAVVDGKWYALDATLLAPRSTLVRIATGRDATDTAFLSTYAGLVELVETVVTATVEGNLPSDDPRTLVSLG
jgi:transglutaminase-like putative cysteine protease